jgi:hypothetical protein
VILYQLFTSKEPYHDHTVPPTQLLLRIATGGLRPTLPDTMPAAQRALVEKCWATDAKARPAMTQVLETLRDI